MCGICGFVTRKEVRETLLQEMIDSIRYRGPDDAGWSLERMPEGELLGFAHRRLAILDLSAKGHQPMESDDGSILLTYNGEIYNFLQLRKELEGKGYRFRSETDTEVLLNAYREWGIDAVQRFNGMFAFALYDRERGCVWLGRDRMGVKPLYYSAENGELIFASELKPFLRFPGFRKELDLDSLMMYLAAEYIPGSASIFRGVRKLLPGELLRWKRGQVETRRYWDVGQVLREEPAWTGTYDEAAEELNALLEDAVRLRMISDVPLGAFLSNGVDSSLTVAKMQKLSNRPVRTFTVGFREQEFDESAAAEKTAAYLRTEHRTEILSIEDGKQLITELPKYFDEPMADPSGIATMLVSRMARRDVTVALSGDAGDELFCGYNTYTHFDKLSRLSTASRILSGIDHVIPLRRAGAAKNARSFVKLFHLGTPEEIIDADLLTWWDRYGALTDGHADPSVFREYMPLGKTLFEKAMLHDLGTYLPDDVLTKVDRASMSCSLETRAPLLDYRIVEFALRLPLEYKYKDGVKKRILKELLFRELPEELIGKGKKGFRIPFAKWLREDYDEMVCDLMSEAYVRRQGLFDWKTVNRMLQSYRKTDTTDFAREVWVFLLFQLWYEEYMRNTKFS